MPQPTTDIPHCSIFCFANEDVFLDASLLRQQVAPIELCRQDQGAFRGLTPECSTAKTPVQEVHRLEEFNREDIAIQTKMAAFRNAVGSEFSPD